MCCQLQVNQKCFYFKVHVIVYLLINYVTDILEIVTSLLGGWSCTLVSAYTLVSGVAYKNVQDHPPREGYNYYITCYIDNILRCCLMSYMLTALCM